MTEGWNRIEDQEIVGQERAERKSLTWKAIKDGGESHFRGGIFA